MRFKSIVKAGMIVTGLLLVLISLTVIGVFALNPIAQNFTNVLILAMILMQLLTVIVLVHIHDVLTGEYRPRRRAK
jgi:hypothetical protein